jgi:hypothetical protein
MSATPTPAVIRAAMAARREADAHARWMAGRRRDAARNGYHGPLTRAELAAQAARDAR